MVQCRVRLLLAVILLLAGSPVAAFRAGAQSNPLSSQFELYQSEQFHFAVWWDPTLFSLGDETIEDGYEFHRLDGPNRSVFYEAYEAPGLTEQECWNTIIAELQGDDAVSDIVLDDDTFIYTYTDTEGSQQLRQTNRCTLIDDGRAVLRTGAVFLASVESDNLWQDPERDQFDHIAYLRESWQPLVEIDRAPSWAKIPTVLGQIQIDEFTGFNESEPTATATLQLVEHLDKAAVAEAGLSPLPAGEHYSRLTVLFANPPETTAPVAIGRDRLYLQDEFGFVHHPVVAVWDLGATDPSTAEIPLAPGESARLQTYFALPDISSVATAWCRCRLTYQARPWSPGDEARQVAPDLAQTPYPSTDWTIDYDRVFNSDGEEIALAVRILRLDGDTSTHVRVLFENTSTEPLVIDPRQFRSQSGKYASNTEGTLLRFERLYSYRWLYGAASEKGTVTIAPGKLAVIEADIQLDHSLFYLAAPDQPIDLG